MLSKASVNTVYCLFLSILLKAAREEFKPASLSKRKGPCLRRPCFGSMAFWLPSWKSLARGEQMAQVDVFRERCCSKHGGPKLCRALYTLNLAWFNIDNQCRLARTGEMSSYFCTFCWRFHISRVDLCSDLQHPLLLLHGSCC